MTRADRVIEGREEATRPSDGGLALVMPMAGKGSRFVRSGHTEPKPLIDIAGYPAFWWATESVRTALPVRELVYVVLEEHVRTFAIEEVIRDRYPAARVVTVPEATGGAAESAAIGVATLASAGPIAINDCDHAFDGGVLRVLAASLRTAARGALVGFRSASPAYAYAVLDENGLVTETIEKRVVGEFAIAGCYLFDSAQTFLNGFARYRAECRYPELYVSGIYNLLLRAGARVEFGELAEHMAFGTPEELARLDVRRLADLLGPKP
jgi:dTDP-glucose pyrophosphorylase